MSARRGVLALLLLAAAAAAAIGWPLGASFAAAAAWAGAHSAAAAALFVALYVVAAVLVVPGSILTLAAGYLFGLPLGAALASAGSVLGAVAAFAVGRFVARSWVERRIAARPRFRADPRERPGPGARARKSWAPYLSSLSKPRRMTPAPAYWRPWPPCARIRQPGHAPALQKPCRIAG